MEGMDGMFCWWLGRVFGRASRVRCIPFILCIHVSFGGGGFTWMEGMEGMLVLTMYPVYPVYPCK